MESWMLSSTAQRIAAGVIAAVVVVLGIGLFVGGDSLSSSEARVQLETCGAHGATGFVVNESDKRAQPVVEVAFLDDGDGLIYRGTVAGDVLAAGEIAEWRVAFDEDESGASAADVADCRVSVASLSRVGG